MLDNFINFLDSVISRFLRHHTIFHNIEGVFLINFSLCWCLRCFQFIELFSSIGEIVEKRYPSVRTFVDSLFILLFWLMHLLHIIHLQIIFSLLMIIGCGEIALIHLLLPLQLIQLRNSPLFKVINRRTEVFRDLFWHYTAIILILLLLMFPDLSRPFLPFLFFLMIMYLLQVIPFPLKWVELLALAIFNFFGSLLFTHLRNTDKLLRAIPTANFCIDATELLGCWQLKAILKRIKLRRLQQRMAHAPKRSIVLRRRYRFVTIVLDTPAALARWIDKVIVHEHL